MRSVATHTRLTSGALRTSRRDSFFGELPATDRSRYAATFRVRRSAWNKFARATSRGILRSLLQHRRRSTGRNEMSLRAIKWENGRLEVLDQILLPAISRYVVVNGVEDGWKVINRMQVRGAPAIAIVGCLSLAVELRNEEFTDKSSLRREIEGKLNYLVSARPTAVNIKTAAEALIAVANMLSKDNSISVSQMNKTFLRVIDSMLEKDIADNKAIGNHGADEILKTAAEDGLMRVLTHCNTGSLATAGYGTALGVVRSLQERKRLEHVYCTETRPYNQGARLTAYELVHDKIPGTLICDDMVAALMKSRTISAVVVGADRVATNGDTANKIGTYQIAILAKYHGVPFYVAAPQTSIDFTLSSGDHIPIEERPDREMTHISDQRIAAAGIQCWNPAFDVTPASLITGIITEVGVFRPEELIKLQSTETTKKDMEELDNYIMRRKFRGSQD